jgi:Methyltransferase domain
MIACAVIVFACQKALMTRNELLLSMFDPSGIGLEVGAGFNPLLPKAAGYRVETLDHATADQLRDKYRNDPNVDVTRIEEVDFVADGSPIGEVVGKPGHYDYIVASHVIEHAPDMLGFLKGCETLLNQPGTLVLAVPDKRRCFDLQQPLTSTGMILQAHEERRTRHPPSALFDDIAYNLLRGGNSGWAKGYTGRLGFVRDLVAAQRVFEEMRQSSDYIDTHAWRFTPSSFRLIASDLHAIGEIGLREQIFHDSDIHEFYITLSRRGQGCPFDRLTLVRMTIAEHQEILLGPEDLALCK